ncbi:hypothetical protein PR048_007544 [Dryococelus australis]|uniref:RNA-directed DNA polymerase n=1 Tax=Dryococelus australis TaxID=614101 RepID=A0ABQ9HUI7_9NEOP|nr:hypothetical protein PR048_007544 [Dryococelus australis]
MLFPSRTFHWTAEHDTCSEQLKDNFRQCTMLACHDRSKHLYLQTDANKGIWLFQLGDNQERHIIEFVTKKFGPTEARYDVNEWECLDVVWAHFPGAENQLADKLSRAPNATVAVDDVEREDLLQSTNNTTAPSENHAGCNAIEALPRVVLWLDELQTLAINKQQQCTAIQNKIAEFLQNGSEMWRTRRMLIESRQRQPNSLWWLYVPKQMCEQIAPYAHSSKFAGHPGATQTAKNLFEHFHLQEVTKDVHKHVKECMPCNQFKSIGASGITEQQPRVPTEPYKMVSLDLMDSYPCIPTGERFILVVSDSFSRWTEAYPVSNAHARNIAWALLLQTLARSVHQVRSSTPHHSSVPREGKPDRMMESGSKDPIMPQVNQSTGQSPAAILQGRELTVPWEFAGHQVDNTRKPGQLHITMGSRNRTHTSPANTWTVGLHKRTQIVQKCQKRLLRIRSKVDRAAQSHHQTRGLHYLPSQTVKTHSIAMPSQEGEQTQVTPVASEGEGRTKGSESDGSAIRCLFPTTTPGVETPVRDVEETGEYNGVLPLPRSEHNTNSSTADLEGSDCDVVSPSFQDVAENKPAGMPVVKSSQLDSVLRSSAAMPLGASIAEEHRGTPSVATSVGTKLRRKGITPPSLFKAVTQTAWHGMHHQWWMHHIPTHTCRKSPSSPELALWPSSNQGQPTAMQALQPEAVPHWLPEGETFDVNLTSTGSSWPLELPQPHQLYKVHRDDKNTPGVRVDPWPVDQQTTALAHPELWRRPFYTSSATCLGLQVVQTTSPPALVPAYDRCMGGTLWTRAGAVYKYHHSRRISRLSGSHLAELLQSGYDWCSIGHRLRGQTTAEGATRLWCEWTRVRDIRRREPVWNLSRKIRRVQLPNLVRNLVLLGGECHDGCHTSPYTGRYGGPCTSLYGIWCRVISPYHEAPEHRFQHLTWTLRQQLVRSS